MKEMRIKTEYAAKRCEICHKTDCFDMVTLFCSRCKNLGNYKEEKFEINKLEFGKKESYLTVLLNKNYGWKGNSNEVNKLFAIAAGIVFFNMLCFIGILMVFKFSRLSELTGKVIYSLVLIFLIEYIPLKLFSNKTKFLCQGGLMGVHLSIAISVLIPILFVIMAICYYFFG